MRNFISIDLKVRYTKENIKYVLEQGSKKGYKYYAFGPDTEFLTLDLAVEGIMNPNEFGTTSVMAKINDLVRDILIVNESGLIGIDIGDYVDEDFLDKIKFILDMSKDFAILDINTIID